MVNGCVRLASPANILAAIFVWQGSREYSDRYFRLGSPANILTAIFVWRVSREYSGRYVRLARLPRIFRPLYSFGKSPANIHAAMFAGEQSGRQAYSFLYLFPGC